MQIHILKYIEDNPNILLSGVQKRGHRLNCDFGGPLIGKMKDPGGNTAERDAPAAIFRSQLQAGTVTGSQQLFVPL